MEIKEMVLKILEKNNEKYGKTFSSNHEFYAVFKEEFEEAQAELENIESYLDSIWDYIKDDNFEGVSNYNEDLGNIIEKGIKELLQMAAISEKYKQQFPGSNIL